MIRAIKLIIVTLVLSAYSSMSFGAWLENVPQKIEQPNGEIINCFATGDEFYHWLHDGNGYTIVLNPDDGFFYYGIREGELVVSSDYLVNSVDPAAVGIIPGLKISERLYLERKSEYTNQLKSLKGAPTTGQVNNLVVYIAFADDSVISRPRSYYKPFFSHEDSVSLKDYFREVSYNRLFVDTYHYPVSPDTTSIVYVDEKPRGYFLKRSAANPDGYTDGNKAGREHELLKRAVDYVDAQIPDTLNIDMNDDGRVDNVCFVLQGSAAGWSDLLWPHRWALYNADARINGKRVWDYLLMLEGGFSVGTLCHEFFHVLGAPDLYHYDPPEGAPTACGRWDIMDSNANPPQYMGAFMKYKYGDWIASLPEITESGTYYLNPLSEPDQNVYKVKSPLSPNEYFVLEYRKKEGRYERSAPGTGLVVYRINPGAGNGNAGGPPDEVYVYRPGGTLTSQGSISSAPLGRSRKAMNERTDPSPFLYNNGQGGAGGLDIFNVSNPGDSISFEINIIKLYPPTQLSFTLSEESVDLKWKRTYVSGLKEYIIYKNGQKFTTIRNRTSYEDPDIQEGQSYSYSVTAVYEGANNGESDPSNEVLITLLDVQELPYFEDFEEANHGWIIKGSVEGFQWGDAEYINLNTDNETRFLGTNSVAAGQNNHTLDYAISPRLNLQGQESVTLEFDYTLKVWQMNDKLNIAYRRNKTDQWVEFFELRRSGIGPVYLWKPWEIEIPDDAYTSEAQIAFKYSDSNEFSYGSGIDNVSIKTNTTGITNLIDQAELLVYPNPSSGKYSIELNGFADEELRLKVLSIEGRELLNSRIYSASERIIDLDLNGYSDGFYYMLLETPERIFLRKLIKSSR